MARFFWRVVRDGDQPSIRQAAPLALMALSPGARPHTRIPVRIISRFNQFSTLTGTYLRSPSKSG